jgi:hypothetical protein
MGFTLAFFLSSCMMSGEGRLPSLSFPSELLGSGGKYDQYLQIVPQVWKEGVGTSARSLRVVSGIAALGCQAASSVHNRAASVGLRLLPF